MKKIDKEAYQNMRKQCLDEVAHSSNENLRERHVFFTGYGFVCIEGNTGGWFIEEAISSFSGSVYWVQSC